MNNHNTVFISGF